MVFNGVNELFTMILVKLNYGISDIIFVFSSSVSVLVICFNYIMSLFLFLSVHSLFLTLYLFLYCSLSSLSFTISLSLSRSLPLLPPSHPSGTSCVNGVSIRTADETFVADQHCVSLCSLHWREIIFKWPLRTFRIQDPQLIFDC